MCQISVVVEKEKQQEKLMEGVTTLEVTKDGVLLKSFFDEPMTVPAVQIKNIDFLAGVVVLKPTD